MMGTQRVISRIVLAWENSSLPRIPFIPSTDEISCQQKKAVEPSLERRAERINWKKFEVLSEVILPIMKAKSCISESLEARHSPRADIDVRMPVDDEVCPHFRRYNHAYYLQIGNISTQSPT